MVLETRSGEAFATLPSMSRIKKPVSFMPHLTASFLIIISPENRLVGLEDGMRLKGSNSF